MTENILCDCSMSTICEFDDIKGKHDLWKAKIEILWILKGAHNRNNSLSKKENDDINK